MRQGLATIVLVCIVASGAHAAAYDDFARGLGAIQRGDVDTAITAFSAAITAGDLAPALLPQAYRGRGIAFLAQNRCAEAFVDLDRALELNVGNPDILWRHAHAAACLNKHDVALADYSRLIEAEPEADAYSGRGRQHWFLADYAGAESDFVQAHRLAPKDPYPVLWLELSHLRAGTLDPAAAQRDVATLSSTGWPGPLLALYAGLSTPEQVAGAIAATSGMPRVIASVRCEGDFYVAEWWLGQRDSAKAQPLLKRAAQDCPGDFVEGPAARFELEHMP